jgi:hypothetical protein
MLVAIVSTDEAFHDFKVQVRNHQRHVVLELEDVSEDAAPTGIVALRYFYRY